MYHSTALTADKLSLTLPEVIDRLPTITSASDASQLNTYLDQLYLLGRQRHIPNISPQNVDFLRGIVQSKQPKQLLEIGCANGFSTLRFWQMTRTWHTQITTMDISKPSFEEACHHFKVTGADTSITAHFGNALEILPSLPRQAYDLIFIDAQKTGTLDFFVRARRLAAEHALIIVDDVLKFKDKMQRFYDYLHEQQIPYQIEQVDADDGVMLIQL